MMGVVEELAGKIGPRGSTTRAERNAAKYLEKTLAPIADEFSSQPFRSAPTFSWAYGLYYALAVVAAILIPWAPLAAALLAMANYTAYLLEARNYKVFTGLLPKGKSQNVIAAKANLAGQRRLPGIILVAHYDTARSGLGFHPRLAAGLRCSFVVLNICMAVIPVSALAAGVAAAFGLRPSPFYGYAVLPFGLYVLLTFLLLAHSEIWGAPVPGGNDNASGVAVLVESFKILAPDLPEGAKLWAVATGCKETGAVGMHHFLEEYGEDIRGDYIINLDNLGIGYIKYIVREGMFHALSADRTLVLAASAFARENPDLLIDSHVYRTGSTDAFPALVRGFKAMSIMAFDANGALPHWHWPTDTAGQVNPDNLAAATSFVQSLAQQIWRGVE